LAMAFSRIRRRVGLRRWWFFKTGWALERENIRVF